MKYNVGDRYLSNMFLMLAKITIKHPYMFIIIPLCIAAFLSTGLYRLTLLQDIEYLFPPYNTRGFSDRALMEKYFPTNYSQDYEEGRELKFTGLGRALVTAKDGGDILREEIFDEMKRLDAIIRNITIEVNDTEYRYRDICARDFNGRCYNFDLFELTKSLDDIKNGIYKVPYPIVLNNVTWDLKIYGNCLGGVEQDGNGHIKSAKAAVLIYHLDSASERFKDINIEWENKFLDTVQALSFENIETAMFVSTTWNNELNADTLNSMVFFVLTIAIMLSFSVVSNMMSDCVRGKPWAGILGCISSTISVFASMGLCLYVGMEFFAINFVIPFIMLGIGLDDTFVLLAAWRNTDNKKSLEQRLCETYRHAGVAITITSVTTFTSFMVGCLTPFRAANILCSYMAVAVVFVYFYQITFFGGCLVLMGTAEQNNLHSLLFVKATPKSLAKHKGRLYQLCMTGGLDPNNPDNPEDNQVHQGMVFFRDVLGDFLCKPRVKIGIIASFVVYLAGAIYGATGFKEGLEMYQLFSQGTYAYDFSLKEQTYFYEYIFRGQLMVYETLDYSDVRVQDQIDGIMRSLESHHCIEDGALTESWLRYFKIFVNDKRTRMWTRRYNLTDKMDFINCLRNVFFKYPPAKRFIKDIVFNENYTEIIATRYIAQIINLKDTVDCKNCLRDTWKILEGFPVKALVYTPLFLILTLYLQIMELTIQAIAITSCIMMVITFFFIPSVIVVVCVAFSIISIELGVIGYMTLWGVNLNATSLVCLIVCVGFSVDNSAHIAYAFVSSKASKTNEKMKDALYYIGVPIMQATISTIIGVMVLPLTPSYNFHVFFKTITLVMIFASSHSLLLLPVLLSILDPLFGNDDSQLAISDKQDKQCLEKLNNNQGKSSSVEI